MAYDIPSKLVLPYPSIFQFYEGLNEKLFTELTGENLNRAGTQLLANLQSMLEVMQKLRDYAVPPDPDSSSPNADPPPSFASEAEAKELENKIKIISPFTLGVVLKDVLSSEAGSSILEGAFATLEDLTNSIDDKKIVSDGVLKQYLQHVFANWDNGDTDNPVAGDLINLITSVIKKYLADNRYPSMDEGYNLTIPGWVKAKVYHPPYSDYGEYFPSSDSSEVGDIMARSTDPYIEDYVKAKQGDLIIGVHTNPEKAYLIGDPEGGVPIALAGRVDVNMIEPVKLGDKITASHIAGKGRVAKDGEQIVGTVVQLYPEKTRAKILVNH